MKVYQIVGKRSLIEDPTLYFYFSQYMINMMSKMEWPLCYNHPPINEELDREID
ncbi:hypothetical protein [Sodalis-like endosymbiont of Proechinophthirus fluctus]|uniref:hypothetical protein n=1 Tax=Sodalis-like endosymbiont of Proechinophthirus fluctus TaxID=1462730 RepID=UPI00164F107F|nr:hypothetical protein [Sodalis-like endosymbiont of Proechinophthirus fluctus]